jgi:hypothetical protein
MNQSRPRLRITRWWWLSAPIVILCGLACLYWFWFTSRGDLAAVAREARAVGLPTTWDGVGHPQSPSAVREAFARLGLVMAAHRAYIDSVPYFVVPRLGDELPAEMRAHLAAIPAEWWQGIERDLAAMPAEPVVIETVPDLKHLGSSLDSQRRFIRLMSELLCVAAPQDLPAVLQVASRATTLSESRCLFQELIASSNVFWITSRLSRRLPELADVELRNRLADRLAELRAGLWTGRLSAGQGEVVSSLEQGQSIFMVHSLAGGGMAFPSDVLSWESWTNAGRADGLALVNRWNRAAVARRFLAATVCDRDIPDLATRIQALRRLPAMPDGLAKLAEWCGEPDEMKTDTLVMMGNSLARNLLILDVLIAVLRGQPLPTDPFAATGAPLKPVMRAGEGIGWYSVGPDGVDDGGDATKDIGVPLTASFGRPRLADPPKSR